MKKRNEFALAVLAADGSRRVYSCITEEHIFKLASDVAFDTQNPGSGASSMKMNASILFLGALYRWNFDLVGKKETSPSSVPRRSPTRECANRSPSIPVR